MTRAAVYGSPIALVLIAAMIVVILAAGRTGVIALQYVGWLS